MVGFSENEAILAAAPSSESAGSAALFQTAAARLWGCLSPVLQH